MNSQETQTVLQWIGGAPMTGKEHPADDTTKPVGTVTVDELLMHRGIKAVSFVGSASVAERLDATASEAMASAGVELIGERCTATLVNFGFDSARSKVAVVTHRWESDTVGGADGFWQGPIFFDHVTTDWRSTPNSSSAPFSAPCVCRPLSGRSR